MFKTQRKFKEAVKSLEKDINRSASRETRKEEMFIVENNVKL